MEFDRSFFVEKIRAHRIDALKRIAESNKSPKDLAAEIAEQNENFVMNNLLPCIDSNQISEKEIIDLLAAESKEDEKSTIFVDLKLSKAIDSQDINNFLFTCVRQKILREFFEEYSKEFKIIELIRNFPNDLFEAMITVAAVENIGDYSSTWYPLIEREFRKLYGEAVPSSIDFKGSTSLHSSLRQNCISLDRERLGKIARGDGLEAILRQRKKEQPSWQWDQDLEFLKFNLFRFHDDLWDEFFDDHQVTESKIKDILPEDFDDW